MWEVVLVWDGEHSNRCADVEIAWEGKINHE